MKTKNEKITFAFSLAEVLITLTVIGVIAAISIPSLILEKEKDTSAKKLLHTYATLQQMFTKMALDNGTPGDLRYVPFLQAGAGENSNTTWQEFQKYLSVSKPKPDSNCYPFEISPSPKYLNGGDMPWFNQSCGQKGGILSNGVGILVVSSKNDCIDDFYMGNYYKKVCAKIYVDTNALQPPNILGKDMFIFYLYNNGIYPAGSLPTADDWPQTGYGDGCDPTTSTGINCAEKVIREGKINY